MHRFGLLLLAGVSALTAPPTFNVNVDTQPRHRWRGALKMIPHAWEDSWGPTFAAFNASLFNNVSSARYQQLAEALQQHFPEQAEELEGIVDDFAAVHPTHHVSYEYLAGWVFFHDLAHTELGGMPGDFRECTGLVAQDSKGTITHVAHMDEVTHAVRNLTLHARFVRADGELIFEGVDWYWFTTGLTRTVRKGYASLSENYRRGKTLSSQAVFEDIARGVIPHLLVFRAAMLDPPEGARDALAGGAAARRWPGDPFEDLVNWLSTIPLAAPYYVIAAGAWPGQGVTIARSQTGVDGPQGAPSLDPDRGTWWLAQTNDDYWKPDTDTRRATAVNTLTSLGRTAAAGPLGLFAAAGTFPVTNPHTAFTAVMVPATGQFQAFVRVAMCPAERERAAAGKYCQAHVE